MRGAGPDALRLGRAEWAWLGVVMFWFLWAPGLAGKACGWREGKWEPPLPTLPHPTRVSAGLFPGSFLGLNWCVSSQSLGSCLCYFNFVCFPVSRLVPKVVLWVSETPGAFPVGAVTTKLTRNDPLGGPAQACLRQGAGGWG